MNRIPSLLVGSGLAVVLVAVVSTAMASAQDPGKLPDPSLISVALENGRGEPIALCQKGEEYNTYGPGESAPGLIVGSKSADLAVDAFLENVRVEASADNPALKSLSEEVRKVYLDYLAEYFQAAQQLRVSESRQEGEMTVFVEPVRIDGRESGFSAFQWSSVRVEVVQNINGLFEVSSAVICGRQLYDIGALTNPIDYESLPVSLDEEIDR